MRSFVFQKILGTNGSYTIRNFIISVYPKISYGRPRQGGEVCGQATHMGEKTQLYKVLVGKPEGKRPLGRPRPRWEDGIRMDLEEIDWDVWIGFSWLWIRAGSEMNVRVLAPRT
jgi:hypothetical protein